MKTFKTKWQNVNTKIESFFNMLYEGFMKFFRKHYLWLVFVVVLIASVIVRVAFFYYISGDMRYALLTWFNYLKANGGFKALGTYPWKETGITKPGDYPVAYINLLALLSYFPIEGHISIKITNIICDYLLAFGVILLIREFNKTGSSRLFLLRS